MSILVDEHTRVVVQGLTGREGSFHAERMLEYGTKVVAGVTPGKGGVTALNLPVFNTVAEAVKETGADVSVIFVPAKGAADSACEAAAAGIRLTVLITEHIPVLDMVRCRAFMDSHGALLLGPNCPGVTSVDRCKIGIMPGYIHKRGPVGIVSRSGTLTYESVHQLSSVGVGQSTCLGIGGDPVGGLTFVDTLKLFRDDAETEAVCLIGEIGGDAEEQAAAYVLESKYPKPVFGFIAGLHAPAGKRMGHAGAVISGGKGKGSDKVAALEAAGITVIRDLAGFGRAVKERL